MIVNLANIYRHIDNEIFLGMKKSNITWNDFREFGKGQIGKQHFKNQKEFIC